MMELRGKKVILRPIQSTYLRWFLSWFNTPGVIDHFKFYLPITKDLKERWIKELTEQKKTFFVIVPIDEPGPEKEPVGTCGFFNFRCQDTICHFGVIITEKARWQKGYGVEAIQLLVDYGFNTLKLHKIESSVLASNKPAIRLHEKTGFVREGVKREHICIDGRYLDLILYGLLRREWQEKRTP